MPPRSPSHPDHAAPDSMGAPSAAPTAVAGNPAPAIRRAAGAAVGGLRREHQRHAYRRAGRAWPAWTARPWVARRRGALGAAAAGPGTAGRATDASAGADAATDALAGRLAELRAVTTRYVCGLRAGGARPEQMLPRVEALVHEAMAADGWLDPEASRVLTAQVVRWSLEAYHDA